MSLSSSGNYVSGLAPFAVLQTGEYQVIANTLTTVPCVGIQASDIVLYNINAHLAGNAGEIINIDPVTNGGEFTSTAIDATFAGNLRYAVVRNVNAHIVNVP